MGFCRDSRELLRKGKKNAWKKLPPNRCDGVENKARKCIKTVPSYNETCCQEKGVPSECMQICSDPTSSFTLPGTCNSEMEDLIEQCLTNETGNHDFILSRNEE